MAWDKQQRLECLNARRNSSSSIHDTLPKEQVYLQSSAATGCCASLSRIYHSTGTSRARSTTLECLPRWREGCFHRFRHRTRDLHSSAHVQGPHAPTRVGFTGSWFPPHPRSFRTCALPERPNHGHREMWENTFDTIGSMANSEIDATTVTPRPGTQDRLILRTQEKPETDTRHKPRKSRLPRRP